MNKEAIWTIIKAMNVMAICFLEKQTYLSNMYLNAEYEERDKTGKWRAWMCELQNWQSEVHLIKCLV